MRSTLARSLLAAATGALLSLASPPNPAAAQGEPADPPRVGADEVPALAFPSSGKSRRKGKKGKKPRKGRPEPVEAAVEPGGGEDEPDDVPELPSASLPSDAPPRWPQRLQTEVLDLYRRGFTGDVHLFVKDVESGTTYTHNAATPVYIASVVKVLFMVALFDQVERGRIAMDEYLEYGPDDVRGGAPLFNYLPVGARVPLSAVVEAMIQQSDNAASDMIVRRVGIETINGTLDALGFDGFGRITSLIEVRRLVYGRLDPRAAELDVDAIRSLDFSKGNEARAARLNQLLGTPGRFSASEVHGAYADYYASGLNSATMNAVGALLEGLALGTVVSSSASRSMLELMSGTQTGVRRITSRIPPETRVAHKTGTQYRRTCDVGVMYLPRPVVFAACVKGSRSGAREDAISRLASAAWELLSGAAPSEVGLKKPKKKKKKGARTRGRAADREGTDTL